MPVCMLLEINLSLKGREERFADSKTRSAQSVREGIKRQKLLSASADARSPGVGTTPGGWKPPRVAVLRGYGVSKGD